MIFSSRVIPGNERVIGRAINALLRRGAEVLWEDVAFVHVSGHASQEDLKHMLALTRPRYFMPVHGEYRHLLQHARLAESVGIPADRIFLVEDGLGLEVTKAGARVLGGYPGRPRARGRQGRRRRRRGRPARPAAPGARRACWSSRSPIDATTGVHRRGTRDRLSRVRLYEGGRRADGTRSRRAVREALAARQEPEVIDKELIGAIVRSAVRRFINQRFQRKPVVLPGADPLRRS